MPQIHKTHNSPAKWWQRHLKQHFSNRFQYKRICSTEVHGNNKKTVQDACLGTIPVIQMPVTVTPNKPINTLIHLGRLVIIFQGRFETHFLELFFLISMKISHKFVDLAIYQRWYRSWLGAKEATVNDCIVYWRTYTSLSLDDFNVTYRARQVYTWAARAHVGPMLAPMNFAIWALIFLIQL